MEEERNMCMKMMVEKTLVFDTIKDQQIGWKKFRFYHDRNALEKRKCEWDC
jgi:hypothetical protein